jgi:hypothetical protein
LVLIVRSALTGGLRLDDVTAEVANGAERGVQQIDLGDDIVLRRLTLRRIGIAECVDVARQVGRGGYYLALLRLVAGVVQKCGELVLQVSEQTCDVSVLAWRALHRVDRLQRALTCQQAGDSGVLAEHLRLQGHVDVARGRTGAHPEARAIGIEALLCADLGRVAGGAGIRDVVRHERQLALDIGQSARRDG